MSLTTTGPVIDPLQPHPPPTEEEEEENQLLRRRRRGNHNSRETRNHTQHHRHPNQPPPPSFKKRKWYIPNYRLFFVPPYLPTTTRITARIKMTIFIDWVVLLLSTTLYVTTVVHSFEWFITFPFSNPAGSSSPSNSSLPQMTPALLTFHFASRLHALIISATPIIVRRFRPRTHKFCQRKVLLALLLLILFALLPLMITSLTLITPHYTRNGTVRDEFFAAVKGHIKVKGDIPQPLVHSIQLRGCFGWTSPTDFGTRIKLPPPTKKNLKLYTKIADGYNNTFKVEESKYEQTLIFKRDQINNTLLPGCSVSYKTMTRRLCYTIFCGSFSLTLLTIISLISIATQLCWPLVDVPPRTRHHGKHRHARIAAFNFDQMVQHGATPPTAANNDEERRIVLITNGEQDVTSVPPATAPPVPTTPTGYVTFVQPQQQQAAKHSM